MKVQMNKEDGNYLLIGDFKDYVDVKKVAYYRFKEHENGNITITFYDKNEKLLKLKKPKKKKKVKNDNKTKS